MAYLTGFSAAVSGARRRAPAVSLTLVVLMSALLGVACKAAEEPTPPPRNRDAAAPPKPPAGCLRLADDPAPAGADCTCGGDCTTGNCMAGKCCSGSACAPKRPDGATCKADGDCESKFCTDGVCCNVACRGPCQVCNLPLAPGECNDSDEAMPDPHKMCPTEPVSTCGLSGLCDGNGKCAKYHDETICRPALCQAITTYGPPGTCDGNGKCIIEPSEPCDPARCENNRCVITCASDAQCAPGKACVNGACGDFPDGRTCAAAGDCLSGHCVDGVCCSSSCDGTCMTCASTGSRGTCVPASAGTADAECDTEPATSCGTNGRCDGKGGCALHDNSTLCRAASCDEASNSVSGASRCTNGTCPPEGTDRSCAPYQGCNGNNCRTSCSSDAQCVSGLTCSGGRCVQGAPPPPPSGDAGN